MLHVLPTILLYQGFGNNLTIQEEYKTVCCGFWENFNREDFRQPKDRRNYDRGEQMCTNTPVLK